MAVGHVRAKPNAADFAACLLHQTVHFAVHFVQRFHGEITTRNARLVGGHGNGVARLGQKGYRVQAAFYRLPFFWGLDELIAVAVNHAVAIQNNQFHDFKLFFHLSNAAWNTAFSCF